MPPVTEVTGEFIALWCLPPHIFKIAAPAARRIYHQQCNETFSTASTQSRSSTFWRMVRRVAKYCGCQTAVVRQLGVALL